jgi:DNA-binding CsgD family transcriptional regulator/tetratricopeptide (TPR) repeat protein
LTSPAGSAPDFVGRSLELGLLGSLVERAVAGEPFLAALVGEAGVGKTALALRAADAAREAGVTTAWARASDTAALPYGLWRDLLADRGRSTSGLDPAAGPTVAISEGADERLGRYEAVVDELCSAAPAIVVLDDLHVADDSSLQLLQHVSRRRPHGVGIIATTRHGGPPAPAILRALVNDSSTTRIDLGGLRVDDVAALLDGVGVIGPAELAVSVHDRTGGNAFLVREMARLLIERLRAGDDLLDAAGAVPRSVVDVVSHRLGALTPLAVDALTAGAILGEQFPIGVVARMLDRPALTLLGAIDEATGAGVVVEADRPGELRFSHALVREAIVEQLGPASRAPLHRTAAEAIAGLYEGRLRDHLGDLAQHWEAAGPVVGYEPAARAAITAGDAAAESLAFEDAVAWYERVLAIGDPVVDVDTFDAVRIKLARAALLAGDVDTWQTASIAAATSAEAREDPTTLAAAALGMEALGLPTWDRQVERWCATARTAGQPDDVTARLLAREAQAQTYLNERDAAAVSSAEALRYARRSDTPTALVDALRARQLERSSHGGLEEREQLTEELSELATRLDDPVAALWARLWRLDTLFERGDFGSIDDQLRALSRDVARVPGPLARWHLLTTRAAHEQVVGRFDDSLDHARQAFDLASAANHPSAFGAFASLTTVTCWHIGVEASGMDAILDGLPPRVADADLDDALVGPFPILAEAVARAMGGDIDAARRAFDRAGRPSSWRTTSALQTSCLGLGARAAIATGDGAAMADVVDLLVPFADAHLTSSAGQSAYMGPCALTVGLLEAGLGRLDDAVTDLRRAVDVADDCGARPFAVEARAALADVLVQRGDPGDLPLGTALLDEAEPDARRLGMAPIVDHVERVRARVVGSQVAPNHPGLPLSPREMEVAALVAAGASNREIARHLVISERTAQNHVQHILTKLSATNRTQIAGWYRDQVGTAG